MTVTVNGETREIPEGLHLGALLEHLGVRETRVAVELNENIVPKADYATTSVREGDVLEVVSFVGGG